VRRVFEANITARKRPGPACGSWQISTTWHMVASMHRLFLTASAALGALAVMLGAFGAHGLTARLAGLADGPQRLEWWKTAALYHLTHALALGLVASVAGEARAGRVACWALVLGMTLFSGSLYVMTLTGQRWLGAVTPLGGLSLIVGWVAFAVAAWGLKN
jgi:uncharacterized membrane protein YgdD (TMEM256/DUF423 family)